jgi:uncharacterized membrane protein YfcA
VVVSVAEWLLLLGAGLVAGVINSVASGGSFFTYPAFLLTGLAPIAAATTTLAALTPGNLAAVPEYWPEVKAHREKYPRLLAVVTSGAVLGIALLLTTGSEAFDTLVPWLILTATAMFAMSPLIRRWAGVSAPSLTDGLLGTVILFVLSIYLTYFGSGVGNMFLAMLLIRGFGEFLSANAAKNIVMTLGTVMAAIAYTVAGHIDWIAAIPVLVGSAVGARFGSKWARSIPIRWLRMFIIGFGLFVAGWQFMS